jgi:hypothetical protein
LKFASLAKQARKRMHHVTANRIQRHRTVTHQTTFQYCCNNIAGTSVVLVFFPFAFPLTSVFLSFKIQQNQLNLKMEVTKRKRIPALVVHTPVPKRNEENAGILDEMWACLLNDYLDNLGDLEEYNSDSSISHADTISTAALRTERLRLRKLKKQEKNRNRLKGKAMERLRGSAIVLAEERSRVSDQPLFHNLESSRYEKGVLLDVASKRIDSKTRKTTESHDIHEPVHVAVSRSHIPVKGGESTSASRMTLEPEAKAPVPEQNWPALKSKSSSIDADGLVARTEWMQIKKSESNGVKSMIDPVGMAAPRSKPRTKARMGANGVIHLEEGDNIIRTSHSDDRKMRHLEQLAIGQRPHKSYQKKMYLASTSGSEHERSLHQQLESRETEPTIGKELIVPSSQYDGLTSRNDPLPATRLDLPLRSLDLTSPSHETVARIDARDVEDNLWSLQEEKRSELDQIRRKKIDREEALVRIRAIKARIAKLEI